MEAVYIFAIFISTFFHCMGLFYCPLEASTDSLVFIIVATMFLNKLKVEQGLKNSRNKVDMVAECVVLCLIMQVLLVAIWYPVHLVFQILVDAMCTRHPNMLRFKIVNVFQEYAAPVGVLAIELAVLLKRFGIEDVQRFYGSKDDLLSESILSIVAQQQKTVHRRENQVRRR